MCHRHHQFLRNVVPALHSVMNDFRGLQFRLDHASFPDGGDARQKGLMTDLGKSGEDRDGSAILIPLSDARRARADVPVTFDRKDLDPILRLYGRMVAAGEWRDYAIDHLRDRAIFSVFRRTSEVPLFQIVKTPALARRQGAYSVVSAAGHILKRGHELSRVLTVFDKQLRLVGA
jgi:hypothetical protein